MKTLSLSTNELLNKILITLDGKQNVIIGKSSDAKNAINAFFKTKLLLFVFEKSGIQYIEEIVPTTIKKESYNRQEDNNDARHATSPPSLREMKFFTS